MSLPPVWRLIPAKMAHDLAPIGLRLWANFFGENETPLYQPFEWRGLKFQNRFGIAGGVDKEGRLLSVWQRLGFGFVEIGTVTPLAQEPNPGVILARDWQQQILWNKMGFPSKGMEVLRTHLEQDRRRFAGPVFLNIGKNRQTPNDQAAEDYLKCVRALKGLGNGFVVNISSPNTSGLRALQSKEFLRPLLESVLQEAAGAPVLVKLSPDLSAEDLRMSLEAAAEAQVSGFVLTNTTLQRPPGSSLPNEGGVSGRFLGNLSRQCLIDSLQILGRNQNQFLMVSVGGIFTADQVRERLDLGAHLVEVYSSLVFRGPSLVKSWFQEGL